MLNKCIEIHKRNHRFKFVNKEVIRDFLWEELGIKVSQNTKKEVLENIAYECLSEENIDLFTEKMKNFGITRADIAEVHGISKYRATKLTEEGKVKKIGEYWSSASDLDIPYYIYSIPDVINLEISQKKKPEIVPEPSDENIAQALYLINKSAKVSRDTKGKMYYEGRYSICKSAKTRSNNLYRLKDAVIKKLQDEGRISMLGFHRSITGQDYLALYGLCGFTFHVPYQGEVKDDELLGTLDEPISAEKTRQTSLNFRQAVVLLEDYSGTKIKEYY